MVRKITQKQRTENERDAILPVIEKKAWVQSARYSLEQTTFELTKRFAKPEEPLHGPGFRARFIAIHNLILDSIRLG